MRECSRCHAPDRRVILREESCTCNAESGIFAPDDAHTPDCLRVGHEVVEWIWPEMLHEREPQLVHDPAARVSLFGWALPLKYRKDWELRQYRRRGVAVPGRYVRTRVLCRDCIAQLVDAFDRQRDYLKASDRAAGKQSAGRQGWAGQIAAQDSLT